MKIFEVDNVKFQITGTYKETVNNQIVWFYDVKNLKTGKVKYNVEHEKIKKYFKPFQPELIKTFLGENLIKNETNFNFEVKFIEKEKLIYSITSTANSCLPIPEEVFRKNKPTVKFIKCN